MNLSVVIPVHNEEQNIAPLVNELAQLQPDYAGMEVVVVDDGSTDGTWSQIAESCSAHAFLKGLRLRENQGQSAALLAGLRHSTGDVLVLMDGDLQNDPKDIPRLVERLRQCDVVCGYRENRHDPLSRRIASRLANAVRNSVTHDGIRDSGCGLKAFVRNCVDDLPPLNGMHRFMPAYFKLHGRRIEELSVNHRPRRFGRSKYTNLRRLPRTVIDLFGFWWYRKRLLLQSQIEPGNKTTRGE